MVVYMQYMTSLSSTKLWAVLYTEDNDANIKNDSDDAAQLY